MRTFFLILCAFLFVGCASKSFSTSFSILSSDKIELPANATSPEVLAEGESCTSSVLNDFDRNAPLLIQQAIHNAIENGNKRGFVGNALIDATITYNLKEGLFYHKHCFNAKGKIALLKKN